MSKKEPTDWSVTIRWKDDLLGLTEDKAKRTYDTIKRVLTELSPGYHYPTVELRQGTILRDSHQVEPKPPEQKS